jgi:hypothetical protein
MNKRRLFALATAAAAVAACGGDFSFGERDDDDDGDDPQVRLIHAIPDGLNISLFRDNQPQDASVTNLPYRGASNYFETRRGTRTWDVRTATNPEVAVGSQAFDAREGHRYTLIALPIPGSLSEVALIDDPRHGGAQNDASVRVLSAAFNTDFFDVYITASNVNIANVAATLTAVGFRQAAPGSGAASLDIEDGSYVLRLTPAGSKTAFFSAPITLAPNTDWLLVPVPASLVPGDVRVLAVQSNSGAPATELINQP